MKSCHIAACHVSRAARQPARAGAGAAARASACGGELYRCGARRAEARPLGEARGVGADARRRESRGRGCEDQEACGRRRDGTHDDGLPACAAAGCARLAVRCPYVRVERATTLSLQTSVPPLSWGEAFASRGVTDFAHTTETGLGTAVNRIFTKDLGSIFERTWNGDFGSGPSFVSMTRKKCYSRNVVATCSPRAVTAERSGGMRTRACRDRVPTVCIRVHGHQATPRRAGAEAEAGRQSARGLSREIREVSWFSWTLSRPTAIGR